MYLLRQILNRIAVKLEKLNWNVFCWYATVCFSTQFGHLVLNKTSAFNTWHKKAKEDVNCRHSIQQKDGSIFSQFLIYTVYWVNSSSFAIFCVFIWYPFIYLYKHGCDINSSMSNFVTSHCSYMVRTPSNYDMTSWSTTWVETSVACVYICVYIYIIYVCVYMYICVCIYIYTYIHVCVCVYIYIYTHVYIYTHTHTHTYIYIYIYVCVCVE